MSNPLRGTGVLPGGSIDDDAMKWREGCLYMPVHAAEGLSGAGQTPTAAGPCIIGGYPPGGSQLTHLQFPVGGGYVEYLVGINGLDIDLTRDVEFALDTWIFDTASIATLEVWARGLRSGDALVDMSTSNRDGRCVFQQVYDSEQLWTLRRTERVPLRAPGVFHDVDANGKETARDDWIHVRVRTAAITGTVRLLAAMMYYTRQACMGPDGVRQTT